MKIRILKNLRDENIFKNIFKLLTGRFIFFIVIIIKLLFIY